MTDAIELRGLRVLAFCGILPEERERRQPFEIDVDVELDLLSAASSDDLANTIDYGQLVSDIERLAIDGRYGLLERFASEVAAAVLTHEKATATRVTIRKLRPPVPQDLQSSGVTVRRSRA
ncbi:MAG: dihydroneopterin aldolase [Acidimicrobiia bacterium]|nr:dihydroneopterin aldolase [Acidimicrobiia bacterium]